jgi:cobalt-zinc-cadmium efflux system membrane fusion protein
MIRRHLVFLIALVSAGVACGAGKSDVSQRAPDKGPKDQIVLSAAEQTASAIETEAAMETDAPEVLRVSGRIARADDRTWRVGVRAEGIVMAVRANLGDRVRKGDVLARYHADEVREERAKYHVAKSELQRSEAAAAQARRNVDRMATLLTLKAASAMEVEHARQELVAADTAVANARIEVARGEDVLEDDLRVPADPKPGDEEADQVPILAPADGFVVERNVTLGRTVAPGQDAFVIGDYAQVWMLAMVRPTDLPQLSLGQSVNVAIPGTDGDHVTGRITNLGQEFDPTARMMAVRVTLDNPAGRLHPEMLVDAEIPVGIGKRTLTVSSDAVQQIDGQDAIFVQTSADRFVVRAVQVGPTAGGRTPIVAGLSPGERVVVRGAFVLKSHLLKSTIDSE